MANLIGEHKLLLFVFVGIVPIFFFNPFAVFGDVFPEERSIKLLGKNSLEFTPYSSVHFFIRQTDRKSSEHYTDEYGAQVGYGLFQNFDVRFQYNLTRNVWGTDGGPDYIHYFFSFGLKYAMVKDQLTIYLPVSFTTGDGVYTQPISFMIDQVIYPPKTWVFYPTIFLAKKINHTRKFELNSSITASIPLKSHYMLDRKDFIYLEINMGMGMYLIPNRLALMSEILFRKNLKRLDKSGLSTTAVRIGSRIDLMSGKWTLWPTLGLREHTFHFRMGITYYL